MPLARSLRETMTSLHESGDLMRQVGGILVLHGQVGARGKVVTCEGMPCPCCTS